MIKYYYALDADGHPIHIDNITKENRAKQYTCPICGGKLIVKKSGKVGPGSRCPHFAHPAHSQCSESDLHAKFKQIAFKILREHQPLNELWIMYRDINKDISFSLLKEGCRIECEMSLGQGNPRPDISIYDSTGKCLFAIEIVNTHEPQDATLRYYDTKDILCIRYDVEEKDILSDEDVMYKLENPDEVYPPSPKKERVSYSRNSSHSSPKIQIYRGKVYKKTGRF